MTDKIVVLSTCASADEGQRLARALVEKRLAACVSLVSGIRSIYRWQDSVADEEEVLLVIKTGRSLIGELKDELERMHSYETPEILALPIVDGSERYLAWLNRELAHKPSL